MNQRAYVFSTSYSHQARVPVDAGASRIVFLRFSQSSAATVAVLGDLAEPADRIG